MNKIKKTLGLFLFSLVLLNLGFTLSIEAINYPQPTPNKYLNDYTKVIKDSEINSIVSIGKELEDKTGAQAIVVVIDSTKGDPIENYAINLFRTWGIGQKDKDNGLLILLAVQDKKWRVEVGRGLEGAVPDALTNRVMESGAKPSFIEGSYGKGLVESYSVLCDYIAKEYDVTLTKSLNIDVSNYTATDSSNAGGGGIILIVLGVLFAMDIILNRGRISLTLLQILFISSFFGRGHGPRGGSGGGGFGGFGGGSSSGGGSSGSW